ncbi:pyridoxamine 5'-phosphate oxidase [Aureimonas sp. SA4125]|uniref:pyridoxamine 5'-phosphate oxidase family protein n=1 Tax=Aureimonas sp. SA4125 TaxID=2826993 RepID=UPI001CC35935|nr:pyridoxamine 5'-phosphate oxidase family protein [Aureimonas sp. SA4125]BDA84020.1 pyridoxamine 5'-phosphate oxidase [Aureimonas sp. SA4125]
MGKQFPAIDDKHRDFIARQKIFFTASAAPGSRINVSPRGTDAFRVLDANTVAYRDLTGSGNETAAHMLADGRLTIMFCAVDGPPMILRLYGHGRILAKDTPAFSALLRSDFDGEAPLGTRHIVVLDVDLVHTSCGYGVPLFDYTGERASMQNWSQAKGEEGLETYRREKNAVSLDGLPTGMFDETA